MPMHPVAPDQPPPRPRGGEGSSILPSDVSTALPVELDCIIKLDCSNTQNLSNYKT